MAYHYPWSQRSYNPLIPKTPGSFLTVLRVCGEFAVCSLFWESAELEQVPQVWKLSETTTSITHYFWGQAIVRRGNRGHLIWPTETLEHDSGQSLKVSIDLDCLIPKKNWVAFTNPLCIHLKLLHVLSPPQKKKMLGNMSNEPLTFLWMLEPPPDFFVSNNQRIVVAEHRHCFL